MYNHRCKGSLEQCISIRQVRMGTAWSMSRHDFDWDSGEFYENFIAEIEYCPFCGKKLDESEVEK